MRGPSQLDQPTPGSLCSSGGGALTDPRSIPPFRLLHRHLLMCQRNGSGIRCNCYSPALTRVSITQPDPRSITQSFVSLKFRNGSGISSVLCRVRNCFITGLTRGHLESLNLYYSGYHPQSPLTNPTCFCRCKSPEDL